MTDIQVKELSDQVYAIDAQFEDVPLLVYLIVGDRVAVIDPGVAETPAQRLFPALRRLGIRPGEVDCVINTHAHHDHRGGNAALLAENPRLEIAAHPADAPWIEDIEAYLRESYLALAPHWEPPVDFVDRIRRLAGRDTPVSRWLADGELVVLGPAQSLRVHHVPAHTPGHVVLHHVEADILFTGDALQGSGTPLLRRPKFFPFYSSVAGYEQSLQLYESLAVAQVATAHHGVCDRDAAAALVHDSRQMMREIDLVLLDQFRRNRGTTLGAALEAVAEAWPEYGYGAQLIKTTRAHLDALVGAGVLVVGPTGDAWDAAPS